jgi:hypothetical protein
MNRSPAGEETLVFIAYMRVSEPDGSQVVDLRPDALVVTSVAADQLDLDRASGKRDGWPGFRYKMTAPSCGWGKRRWPRARPGLRGCAPSSVSYGKRSTGS